MDRVLDFKVTQMPNYGQYCKEGKQHGPWDLDNWVKFESVIFYRAMPESPQGQ